MDLKQHFEKMRHGDKDAFTQVYNELKKPVLTIACRITRSKEAAEDITQEVFVKLFTSPPDSSVSNPRAWVFQMARNLSIDALRKKQCTNIDGIELTAEDEAKRIATRLDIERAIGRLSREEREILSLRLNGDLGFSEIARIVGLSVPSTYRRYRKAIKELRDLLNGGAL